jgi:phenylalanyl-tRNA synthetase beta chain
MDEILNIKKLPPKYKDIPSFPAVKRDIAMMVPSGITNRAIVNGIKTVGGSLIEDIVLFDKYEGGQIEKGFYSLAYSITYRDPAKTLTDNEVNSKHAELSEHLVKELGVKVRK